MCLIWSNHMRCRILIPPSTLTLYQIVNLTNVLVDNHKDRATFTQRRRGQLKGSLVNISVINSKLKQECKFYVKIKSLLLKSSLNHYHTIRQNLPQPTSNFTKSTQIKRS